MGTEVVGRGEIFKCCSWEMNIKVYTSIMGEKDPDRSDVICLSGYNKFNSNRMNAKIYKVLPHLFLDTDWSIWVDGNIRLKEDPSWYVNKVKEAGKQVGFLSHNKRKSLYDEAEYCIHKNLDKESVIREQIDGYKAEEFDNNVLCRGGVVIRKHCEKVNRLNERWWAEICRGSERDQISLNYVFRDPYIFPTKKINIDDYYISWGHIFKD